MLYPEEHSLLLNIVLVSFCSEGGGPYRGLVLVQHLVIPAQRHAEDDGRHVLKTVDPLLPLRPLTSDIEQPDRHTRT